MFGMMTFVLSSHCYTWWALLSWRCLPMGNGEWTPCFALLACAALAFPNKLPLSQPPSFPAFTLPVLTPIPLVGVWASGCLGLGCWLGLNHESWRFITEYLVQFSLHREVHTLFIKYYTSLHYTKQLTYINQKTLKTLFPGFCFLE